MLEVIGAVGFLYYDRSDHSQKRRPRWRLSSLRNDFALKFPPPLHIKDPIFLRSLNAHSFEKTFQNAEERERERALSSALQRPIWIQIRDFRWVLWCGSCSKSVLSSWMEFLWSGLCSNYVLSSWIEFFWSGSCSKSVLSSCNWVFVIWIVFESCSSILDLSFYNLGRVQNLFLLHGLSFYYLGCVQNLFFIMDWVFKIWVVFKIFFF